MKYVMNVREILETIRYVQAESDKEAIKITEEMYYGGEEIVLGPDDCVGTEFKILLRGDEYLDYSDVEERVLLDFSELPLWAFFKIYNIYNNELIGDLSCGSSEEVCYPSYEKVWIVKNVSLKKKIRDNVDKIMSDTGFIVFDDKVNDGVWLALNGSGMDIYKDEFDPLYKIVNKGGYYEG